MNISPARRPVNRRTEDQLPLVQIEMRDHIGEKAGVLTITGAVVIHAYDTSKQFKREQSSGLHARIRKGVWVINMPSTSGSSCLSSEKFELDDEEDYRRAMRKRNVPALFMAIGRYMSAEYCLDPHFPRWLADAISGPWGRSVMKHVVEVAEAIRISDSHD